MKRAGTKLDKEEWSMLTKQMPDDKSRGSQKSEHPSSQRVPDRFWSSTASSVHRHSSVLPQNENIKHGLYT